MWDLESNDLSILKPCPFCGSKVYETEDNGMEICIECKECDANIYKCQRPRDDNMNDYVKECRTAWNKRT